MLEVCERFNMRIDEYLSLPIGDRALYNQYTIIKIEAESKVITMKFAKGG